MNELQKLRTYYELLPVNVRERKTAQSLLRAIQIAEKLQEALECSCDAVKVARTTCEEIRASEAALKHELATCHKQSK